MANQYINGMTDLWNSSGTVYSSIKMNVTNAASAGDVSSAIADMSKLIHLQVGAVDKYTVDKFGSVIAAGTLTSSGVISSGAAKPSANDAAALGASGTAWSDLFLASGGVINWNAGDVAITHAADQLIFAGAASGYSFSNSISPTANDGAALGVSGTAWSDLYLATGAVINFGVGNAVLTHSDGVVTATTGDLRVTTAGANTASVVTVGGAQTLTSKILSSPSINTPTIAGPTLTGTAIAATTTWSNLGAVTTVDINGGTIDGTPIGATTPAAITGTVITGTSATIPTITASTSVTSPTGTFATSVTGGIVNSSQVFQSTGTSVILAPALGNNTIYLRPRGFSDATEQVTIDSSANVTTTGAFTAVGQINSSQNFVSTTANCVMAATGAGTVVLRPRGTNDTTYQAYQQSDGGFRSSFFHCHTSPTATHSFYNSAGPTGATSWGMIVNGGGGANTGAAHFAAYNGHPSPLYLGFHQPTVAYWGIYNNGPAIGASAYTVSDAKIKSDITNCDCNEAYHKVRAIGVKSYRKDDGIVSRKSVAFDEMGFLAQDIEQVLPEAVLDVPIPRNDDKGFAIEPTETIKATNDRTLLATLWAAFQHQTHIIERLEAKVTALEKK